MPVASKFTDDLKKVVGGIENELKALSKMESKIDTELSTFYHQIEVANYSASQGYMKMRELQDILRRRRIIKQEFSNLNYLSQHIDMQRMQGVVKKAEANLIKSVQSNIVYTDGWNVTFEDLLKINVLK